MASQRGETMYPKKIFSVMNYIEFLFGNPCLHSLQRNEQCIRPLLDMDFSSMIRGVEEKDIARLIHSFCQAAQKNDGSQSDSLEETMKSDFPIRESRYLQLNAFDIAVCATVSAGKSTLVNALLGSDVLPSRNEATTAKITSVYDRDGLTTLKGICQKGTSMDFAFDVRLDTLDEWNSSPDVQHIFLQGDLDGIKNNEHFAVAVHDTPGTNNSGDDRHHDMAFNFLTSARPDAVLYVSNAQHWGTDDERSLLLELKDRVLDKGARLIVAFNKVESLDPQKEDVAGVIAAFEDFLRSLGVNALHVVPVSARPARLFKMALKGKADSFSSRERRDFNLALSLYADAAGGSEDLAEALDWTGLPRLESVIEAMIAAPNAESPRPSKESPSEERQQDIRHDTENLINLQADLLYNPYLKQATLTVEGEPVVLDCFGDNKTRELSEWVSDFFEDLYNHFLEKKLPEWISRFFEDLDRCFQEKKTHLTFTDIERDLDFLFEDLDRRSQEKKIHLTFTGIERDLDFLIDAANFTNKNDGYHVTVEPKKIIRPNAKLDRLKEMFEKLQRESPFEELKSEDIGRDFEKAVSDEFEIAVVAAMSSGKSTLINAMLGREILPAGDESTTAAIARIHNIDGAPHFRATAYDREGKEIASCDPVSLEIMGKLNSNSAVSSIEIEGDIKGIDNSDDMKLVLIDTPGSDNSRAAHKSIIYELLVQGYKPMILYILNAAQLEVNDDYNLLEHVSQEMQKNGRQNRDRFLFVLNKADVLDPDKGESVAKKIEDVRAYLDCLGISDPRIFPCASQLAKIIRLMKADANAITARERRTLMNDADFFIEEEACHFSDFALKGDGLLGKEAREKLQAMLDDARKRGDRYAEALIYTGIPSVELAISEYLSRYALPARITRGLDSLAAIQDINHFVRMYVEGAFGDDSLEDA